MEIHFKFFFGGYLQSHYLRTDVSLRNTVERHSGYKNCSVHSQWNQPQGVKFENSAHPSKNSPPYWRMVWERLARMRKWMRHSYPNISFQTRSSYSNCSYLQSFVVHTVFTTLWISWSQNSKIRYSQLQLCTVHIALQRFVFHALLITTKFRWPLCNNNYKTSFFMLNS